MRKRKPFLRLLAMILAAMLIVLNGYSTSSLTVNAASTDQFEQIKKVLPTGTILKSDTFPGLKVLYGGKDSYTIGEGKNIVNLSIEVIDAELAKKSLSTLSFVFGKINLDAKKGEKATVTGFVSGISEAKYKALVSVLGYKNLEGFITQLNNKNKSSISGALLTSFLTTLTSANEYEQFMEALESAIAAAIADKVTDVASADTPIQPNKVKPDGIKRPDRKPDVKPDPKPNPDDEKGTEGEDEPDEKESYRTIMIFLNGCDLETKSNCATKNLLDLLSAPMPDNTRIFITTGGTETWHMNDIDAYKKYAKEKLYPDISDVDLNKQENKSKKDEIEALAADYFAKYKTEIGQDIQIYEVQKGEVNTLSLLKTESDRYFLERSYLTEYIDYVRDNTDSETYDLIIWDHGGGIDGFGNDEIYNKDLNDKKTEKRDDVGFTNIELVRKAIEDSQIIAAGSRFDFIGFDTCQMATVEVASTLEKLADYLILSEENEPGNGWDYNKWMSALNDKPEMSVVDLSSTIVDTFVAQYANNKDINATLSVIDTSKLQAIDQELSVFAQYLVRDYLDEKYHDSILETIGKTGDYGSKYGYNRQGLLDVVHLCTPFLDDGKGKWTQELMDASASLSKAVEDAVVKSKSTTGINDNGLSINVPLNVASRSYAGKNENGEELYYYGFVSDDVLGVYNDISVNPDYKKAYAQIALNKLAAIIIGDSWLYDDYTIKDVLNVMQGKDEYKSKRIREVSGVDLNDPSDPVTKSIDQLLKERVSVGNITILSGENLYGTKDPNVATVKITNIDPVVVDDIMTVNVALKTGEKSEIELGSTKLYTSDYLDNPDEKAKLMTIKPFDNMWYVINDQISDFVVTSYDVVNMTYKGYILLGLWYDLSEIEGDGSVNRDEYIADKIKNNKLSVIQLNVEGTIDSNTGQTNYLNATNYCYTTDGVPSVTANKLEDIENCYLEILGGTGSLTNSLGTILASTDTNKPDEGFIRLGMQTIKDLQPAYSFTDSYGVEYELSDAGLKAATDENKSKTLDCYKYDIPQGTEVLTYAQSQERAEAMRKKATQDAKAEQSKQAINSQDRITRGDDPWDGDADPIPAIIPDITPEITPWEQDEAISNIETAVDSQADANEEISADTETSADTEVNVNTEATETPADAETTPGDAPAADTENEPNETATDSDYVTVWDDEEDYVCVKENDDETDKSVTEADASNDSTVE